MLLVGATGTGKELFAQHIHEMSRCTGRLVAVNCGALPRDMIESLLFGHCRGAFTGAVEATSGLIEAADRGTLFLDELCSLPVEAQVKLLRVIESKEVARLGETRTRPVAFRVVASAEENLRERVDMKSFRLDLYERVAGVVLTLSPLRDRPEDIVPLAEHFANLQGRCLERAAIAVLLNYSWPGNVRELRVAIERAGFLSENGTLGGRAVAEAIALGGPGCRDGLRPARDERTPGGETEVEKVIAVCRNQGWDARQAAAALGVSSATLYRKLRALGLSLRVFRSAAKTREDSQRILTLR